MKPIDTFINRHGVDVGMSCGLLTLTGALSSFYGVLGQLFVGRVYIDLFVPLGVVVGIALWRHAPWSRILLLIVSWVAVVFWAILLVAIPFTGTGKLTLTIGKTAIKQPDVSMVYVLSALVAPVVWFILAVLHSEKAKSEFEKPIQRAENNAGAASNPTSTLVSDVDQP